MLQSCVTSGNLTSLGPSFLICKMERIVVSAQVVRIKSLSYIYSGQVLAHSKSGKMLAAIVITIIVIILKHA